LRERTQEALIRGFKELYDHGILKKPKVRLKVDKGVEFTDLHNDPYFDKVHIRRGLTNRHRQQALVEFKNQVIGTLISQLQAIDELKTGQTNTSWVKELPFMIKEINEVYVKPVNTQISDDVLVSSKNRDIIPKGTLVRR